MNTALPTVPAPWARKHVLWFPVDTDLLEPQFRRGDIVGVDGEQDRIGCDAVYMLVLGDGLVLPRYVTRLGRGRVALTVTYPSKTVDEVEEADLMVIGRVAYHLRAC